MSGQTFYLPMRAQKLNVQVSIGNMRRLPKGKRKRANIHIVISSQLFYLMTQWEIKITKNVGITLPNGSHVRIFQQGWESNIEFPAWKALLPLVDMLPSTCLKRRCRKGGLLTGIVFDIRGAFQNYPALSQHLWQFSELQRNGIRLKSRQFYLWQNHPLIMSARFIT